MSTIREMMAHAQIAEMEDQFGTYGVEVLEQECRKYLKDKPSIINMATQSKAKPLSMTPRAVRQREYRSRLSEAARAYRRSIS